MHAGIPRLIQSAWDQSGLGLRVPISYNKDGVPKHVIRFEKITLEHASVLLQKYLKAYRISSTKSNDLSPFTQEAIEKITEISEFNASKILKMAYELLERAVDEKREEISVDMIMNDEIEGVKEQSNRSIYDASTKNLMQEAG